MDQQEFDVLMKIQNYMAEQIAICKETDPTKMTDEERCKQLGRIEVLFDIEKLVMSIVVNMLELPT